MYSNIVMLIKTNQRVELTEGERLGLVAYRKARKLAGMNPTIDEIAAVWGKSRNYSATVMRKLVAKGRLTRNGRKYRCFGVPPRSRKHRKVAA